jgi:hypothetical protein
MRRTSLRIVHVACIGSSLFVGTVARGDGEQARYFIGLPTGGTANWSEPLNWTGGEVPAPGDTAALLYEDAFDRTVNLDASTSLAYLLIGNLGGGPTTLHQLDNFNITASAEYVGSYGTSAYGTSVGRHIQDGGVNNIGSLYISTETADDQRVSVGSYIMNGGELHTSYIGVGAEGSGTFEQNAGHVSITPSFTGPSFFVGKYRRSSGTYHLRGGSLTVVGDEHLGYSGSGTFIQSGGTHTLIGNLSFGMTSVSGGGTYILSGADAVFTNGGVILGRHQPGMFIQTEGTHQVNGYCSVGSPYPGVYELSGGLLTAQSLNVQSGTFTWSGGSLSVSSLTVSNRMTVTPGGTRTLKVDSVGINNPTATLDLTDNNAIVDYTDSPGTLANDTRLDLRHGALLTSMSDDGHRLGYADNAVLQKPSFAGESFPPDDFSQLLIMYTYGGDSNLDGQVDVADLSALASNWQTAGAWTDGDFDYSGHIDVADLGLLASNWQAGVGNPLGPALDEALASFGLGTVTIPEPAALGSLLALLALRYPAPRRRSR